MPATKQPVTNKTQGSKLLTLGLTLIFACLLYPLIYIDYPHWLYSFSNHSLLLGLFIILLFRTHQKLLTPAFKSSVLIVFWATFIVLMIYLLTMDQAQIARLLSETQSHFGWEALLICALLYLVLLSIPFVPGVEIGLIIMATFGKDGAIAVYLATVSGLGLAYFYGYAFPHLWKEVGLYRFKVLPSVKSNSSDAYPRVLHFLYSFLPWIMRFRYLTIALLVNLPGNAIFGGGGGIAFICGASRKLTWFGFLMTLSIATLPIPLMVYFGLMEMEKFIP